MIVKLQPSCGTFSIFALLNSEVTAPIFTKISHDVEALVQLFSPLGKVAGRAIYFTDVFSIFF